MTRLNIIAMTLAALGLAGFMASAANADIYTWTDENGVKHFTNHAPPEHAELLMKTPKVSQDEADQDEAGQYEAAPEQRLEEDRLAMAKAELLEREALLLEQQREAERRIAAAAAQAEAAVQKADQILSDAEAAAESAEYDSLGSYGYGYYYPYYRIGKRGYYSSYKRYNLSLYRKDRFKNRRYHSNKHNKHQPKRSIHKRYYSAPKVPSHYSLTRGRYMSHSARTAAFRGRHGRF